MIVKRKIRIQRVSAWNIGVTAGLAVLFAIISIQGNKEFHVLQTSTEQYIQCENAAKQLQDASDYLTEQVRLFTITGQREYMDLYFTEADVTQRREQALESLRTYFDGTDTFTSLQAALDCSEQLMETEYYSMRLMSDALALAPSALPNDIRDITLTDADRLLPYTEKISKAQDLVCNDTYQSARVEISNDVTDCMNSLITQTRNRQGRATTIFSDMYLKLETGITVLVVLMFAFCLIIRRLVVKPLILYNESVKRGVIFPVTGAAELQALAVTYNKVYEENQETQKLIRHEAEYDALTDLLNRGSFEKLLRVYENGDRPFAMLLIDVDTFKSVNDTYGHDMGDQILKHVATLLKKTFRSADYVCRIGGDEFAVIMVEMTTDLQHIIQEKVAYINDELAKSASGPPPVSISVGVAFTDREKPGESIFKDADKALYLVKENGRRGCAIY